MASPPVLEDPNLTSRRAKTRIGVAVVLLAVAIGGLALLSRHKPESQIEEPQSQKQESLTSRENKPATPAPEAPAQISSAQQEPPPAPETPVAPPPPPPPAPVVSQLPPEPTPSAAPVSPRSVTTAPAKPAEKPAAPPPPAKAATAEKPAPAKPAPAPVPAAKPEPAPKAYEVQVGVFTDMENARQLQAKLAEHGIPSHTETKLQVGPFNTKAEAEAAQVKLKALGMGAVILPTK